MLRFMRIMSYNVMEGGILPNPNRLSKIKKVIQETSPDIIGIQEAIPADKKLKKTLETAGYPFFYCLQNPKDGVHNSTVAFLSKLPLICAPVGNKTRTIQTTLQTKKGEVHLINTYLSHLDEKTRLNEIEELLPFLSPKSTSLLFGDFNSLSPDSKLTEKNLPQFSPRMKEKYCIGDTINFEVFKLISASGYQDVAPSFYHVHDITKTTQTLGGEGKHTLAVRIDYFFATPKMRKLIKTLKLHDSKTAMRASDHFPWYVDIDAPFM